MSNKYYSILTKIGQAQFTNTAALGNKLKLKVIKVGDGGDDNGKETSPKESDTQLIRERWSGQINDLYVNPENQNWLVIESTIPDQEGGFYITEFGIYDDQDNLVAIGKYPKTYKPNITEGSGSSLFLRIMLQVSNASQVEMNVDPAIMLASKRYVEEKYVPKTGGTFEGDLTCSGVINAKKGINLHNQALVSHRDKVGNIDHIWHDDGNSGDNSVYNGAWHFCSDAPKLRSPGNSRLQAGSYSLAHKGKLTHLKTGDSFSSFSNAALTVVTEHGKSSIGMANTAYCHFTTEAGSFYFDKSVHVKGEIYTGNNYKKRVFHDGDQTDSVNDHSPSKLASAKAVKTVYDKASAALPKSGGTMTGVIDCARELNGGRHALNLNNSDVIGINGLYCKDTAQAKGEGLVFPKENNITLSPTIDWSKWMSLRCYKDHALFWDGSADRKLYHEGYKPSKADIGLGSLPNVKTDAINDSSSNKLATAKAVKTAYEKALEDTIKSGMIMMWAGATNQIPTGWALCNGQGKTSTGLVVPDLRDRFIVGAGKSYNPKSTGGANSKSTSAAGNHKHGITVQGHALTEAQLPHVSKELPFSFHIGGSGATAFEVGKGYNGDNKKAYISFGSGHAHAHGASSSNAGSHSHTVDARPPYYALCFIIKL